MGILDNIKSVDDYPDRFKGLIYGHWGCGKTQWAADAPEPLWLDFEKSTETLRHINKGKIKAVRPKTMAEVESIVIEAVKDKSPFETIVVDTANSLQVFQMLEHMLAATRGSNRDKDLPYQADYRKSTSQLGRIFHELHHCDKNVIILCQERIHTIRNDDGSTRVVAIRPDVTQRFADLVEQMLNFVGYLEKTPGATSSSPVKRAMYVNPSGKIFAKNRFGIQEVKIENPTYRSIYLDRKK